MSVGLYFNLAGFLTRELQILHLLGLLTKHEIWALGSCEQITGLFCNKFHLKQCNDMDIWPLSVKKDWQYIFLAEV